MLEVYIGAATFSRLKTAALSIKHVLEIKFLSGLSTELQRLQEYLFSSLY